MLARLLLCSLLLATPSAADVKAKTRVTASGATVETTTLVQGSRVRQEPVAGEAEPRIIRVYQCDLQRLLLLNPQNKTYRVISLAYAGEGAGTSGPSRPVRSSRSGMVVTLTTTVLDMESRREVAGYSARGVDMETSANEPEGSCSAARKIQLSSRGWYADMKGIDASCADPNLAGLRLRPAEPGCSDRVEFRLNGRLPQGLPLLIDSTFATSEGEVSMKQELVGITEVETLDARLFDTPADSRLVQTQEELLAADGNDVAPEQQPGVTRPERATRSGEGRPESIKVCLTSAKGFGATPTETALLRLGAFLNRQGFESVLMPRTPEARAAAARDGVTCAFVAVVEKVRGGQTADERLTFLLSEVDKAGRAKMGTVIVKPDETEDHAWESLAKAIAAKIPKPK